MTSDAKADRDAARGGAGDGAMGDILGRIRDIEGDLSRSQTKIAQAVLSYPRLFVEKPVEELCGWIGVSAPTIIRFCRSVGCEGLRDFKLQVMGAMRVGPRYLEPQEPPDTLEGVREQVSMRAQHAIMEAVSVPDVRLEQAIDAILGGGTLYAFGSGGVSSWLVEEVQNRFFRLGVRVMPCRDGLMQTMLASTINRGDVLLCCSLGGVNKDLVTASSIAANYGATTIALTQGGSPLAENVDIALEISVLRNDGDVLGPSTMRYSYLAVIDLLAFGAAIRSRPHAMEKLRRLKQQFVSNVDEDASRPLCD
ncbi:MurR/RpiR family transcriptional regulator [Pelagibius sp. CAU 1746]|uniref:MurR/RpiR family transcriptional regulator n=1 Tax=Pelagibius sp. CAU 1746 TaxID=3140370 RepID=UPI00325B4097